MVRDEMFGAQYAFPAMGFPVFHLPSKNIALDIILSKPCILEIHIKLKSRSRIVQTSCQIWTGWILKACVTPTQDVIQQD